MEHRTPSGTYRLASIRVGEERAEPSLTGALRGAQNEPGHSGRARPDHAYLGAEPDKTIGFLADEMGGPEGDGPTIAVRCIRRS